MRSLGLMCLALAAATLPTGVSAWGYEGHKVIADIARAYLSPAALTRVDALLATDTGSLTQTDMASRSTWADAWRGAGHRETAQWHFVDVEIDHPDLGAACFGFPAASALASAGPAQDCVVNKIEEFGRELASPATAPAERLLALKYVLHFVGDLHQPLHAGENHDRGGNCVQVSLGGPRTTNLHSYWDTAVVEALGADPDALAVKLRAQITPAQRSAWEQGDVRRWAAESFGVATATVYQAGSRAGCGNDSAPITLPVGYDVAAQKTAVLQLQRAGVRLALVLNGALGGTRP